MGDWLGALKKQKNWPGQQVGSWKERNDIKINQLCPLGCFKCDTLSKKNCHASTIPSREYINHIQKNFFPRTSLEGQTTWSKKVTQGSLFVAKTYFLIIIQPLWIPSGVPRRGCSIFFCSNTLPFFATDTYKLVAQGSLFIWVYSDYLSFSI